MDEKPKYLEENPQLKPLIPTQMNAVMEAGDWQNRLIKKHPSWNDVLGKVQKMPGSTIKKL